MPQRSLNGLGDAPPGLAYRAEWLQRVLEEVCRWVEEAAKRLGRATVLVFGSYVRGDFNVWSDVDVVIVSDAFKGVRYTERWRLLPRTTLPLDVIAWTPGEAAERLSKPSWRKALEGCAVARDDYGLASMCRKNICARRTG